MLKHPVVDGDVFEESSPADIPGKRKRGRPVGSKSRTTNASARFTVSDFSFLRATMQGIALKAAASRYLLQYASIDGREAEALRKRLLSRVLSGGQAYLQRMPDTTPEDKGRRNAVEDALGVIRYESVDHLAINQKTAPAPAPAPSSTSISAPSPADERIPTLDEFAVEAGMEDWALDEVTYAYMESWGDKIKAADKAAAQAKAISNAEGSIKPTSRGDVISALGLLQSLISLSPTPADAVSTWINAQFADKLRLHGVISIGDLANWVNIAGRAWHRRLPGVGKSKASRVTQWLVDNEIYTGIKILPEIRHAADIYGGQTDAGADRGTAVVTRGGDAQVESFGIVPLEAFAWPMRLLGVDGEFRSHESNTYGALNDAEAVQGWFQTLRDYKPATQTIYRRAIERLVLWAMVERGCALSSLRTQDLNDFRDFLRTPPAHWVQNAPALKGSALWRPMRGPLSGKSLALNMAAVSKMYKAWSDVHYLRANPAAGMAKGKRRDVQLDVTRTLTLKDIGYVKQTLDNLQDGPVTTRLRAILLTFLNSGLRADELISLRWAHVEQAVVGLHTQESFVLRVLGKGNRERILPLKHECYVILKKHLDDRKRLTSTKKLAKFAGLADNEWPLIGILDETKAMPSRGTEGDYSFNCARAGNTDASLTYERLKNIISSFFAKCARLAVSQGDDGSRLRAASPHWLRHTFAHLVLEYDDKNLSVLQTLLGHASISTTGLYVKADMEKRIESVSKIPSLL